MGISIGELKPGNTILYNQELYIILACEHAKIARGSAFCRVKLKNLKTNQVFERTLRDSDNVSEAVTEKRKLQYLYQQAEQYHFMDLTTYDDLSLSSSRIADKAVWLKEDLGLIGFFYDDQLIDLELPSSLIYEVVETEPGYKGDTVKQGTKPAKLKNGLVVNVPIFVNNGERIKVDTRTKAYLGRA
ncbi:MAG: elongation factor P [Candidatus Omnitrophica bacterium]|nr:elongation factor P [Candidatus Omnitrophota bacterium]MBU2044461.1 elongation factor P [Candidatus Omnitrophota bacterium]MBU2251585.1 elongation factor P [Candidatus Omnitrophota bacterium]MBU2266383.1 elongation factor P [Candidatus Omnitrophota bacterium]MBU2474091.1 elongation factor P [Candidatus Omnitrophota bacterium]